MTQLRSSVAEALNLGLREYDQLLKASREQDKKAEERSKPGQNNWYVIDDRKICEVKYSDTGVYTEPLCNFIAEITDQIYRDDGDESSLEFALEGRLENGQPLHSIRVPSSSFNSLNWVSSEWGVEAIIRAGVAKKDRLREAIQLLSPNIIKRRIYTHIGWTKIDGQYVYLSASGGLRAKDVSVDLEKGLDIYRLPTEVQNPVTAMQASLRFLEVGPTTVTIPLWAAVFLAPLSENASVAFALWLYGITGTRKSTLAALALNHYGDGFTTTSLPADWWATDNSLEKNLFIAKDALFVIDDYRPESDPIRRRELEGKVARIIRQVGNRSGRSRMKADLTLRKTYRPRGLLLSTGEQIPSGQSIVARLFVLEIKKDDLDLVKLTAAQNESHLYSQALAGYLDWLAPQIEQMKSKISTHWKEIRQSLMNNNQHGRIPEIVASLVIGLELGLRYALEINAITQEEYRGILQKGKDAILLVANQQSNRVDREKPTFLFFTILADLLVQQRVCLTAREGNSHGLGGNPNDLNKPERIGWYDDQYFYLLPSTYNRISRYCHDEGKEFPAKEGALRKMLKEEGYLISEEGRNTNRLWDGDSHERVLQIRRAVLDEFSVNKIPTWKEHA